MAAVSIVFARGATLAAVGLHARRSDISASSFFDRVTQERKL
jgi:hypothetical protein